MPETSSAPAAGRPHLPTADTPVLDGIKRNIEETEREGAKIARMRERMAPGGGRRGTSAAPAAGRTSELLAGLGAEHAKLADEYEKRTAPAKFRAEVEARRKAMEEPKADPSADFMEPAGTEAKGPPEKLPDLPPEQLPKVSPGGFRLDAPDPGAGKGPAAAPPQWAAGGAARVDDSRIIGAKAGQEVRVIAAGEPASGRSGGPASGAGRGRGAGERPADDPARGRGARARTARRGNGRDDRGASCEAWLADWRPAGAGSLVGAKAKLEEGAILPAGRELEPGAGRARRRGATARRTGPARRGTRRGARRRRGSGTSPGTTWPRRSG